MADSTVGDAIEDVARWMGMVNGQNMTPYSDDAVLMYLKSAHALISDESEWDEMIVWRERTLDGATGKVTELITDTNDWKNIVRIYHDGSQTPLAKLTSYSNPLISTSLYGYRGLDPNSDNSGTGRYLVQFYPPSLTGQVLFQISRAIDWTNRETVLPIDYHWHVYLAAYLFATQDGTNPGQIQTLAQLMEKRKGQVMSKENSRGLYMQPNQYIPLEWWESDGSQR